MDSAMNSQQLSELLALRFIYKKRVLASSYTLHQLFTFVGAFAVGTPQLLAGMEADGLIQHEGFFDATSGLLKNIALTSKGALMAEQYSINTHQLALEQEFSNFHKYRDLF